MRRRLAKYNDDLIVPLPEEYLLALGLDEGDDVWVRLDEGGRRIVLVPSETLLETAGVDDVFARQVAEFVERYRVTLEALAE